MSEVHVISLGAGVQSSTMLAMADAGELTPRPEYALFADTQREPKAVYEWLDYLKSHVSIPIVRVSRGDLGAAAARVRIGKQSGKAYTSSNIPVFLKNPDGSRGIQGRQCTSDFKIQPIRSWLWNLRKSLPSPKPQIIMWLGISIDEASRMKPS